MPEYPDNELYLHALRSRFVGETLQRVVVLGPALLRTVKPPLTDTHGKRITGFRNIGKRIVFELEEELFLIIHLMIAGRFHLKKPGTPLNRRNGQASFEFEQASLHLTEASRKKRASLSCARGEAGLAEHDPGGVSVFDLDVDGFAHALRRENHTVKRCLTDPTVFSGIGNAYSDEILHRARMSPFKQSTKLDDEEMARLHEACRQILIDWKNRLIQETGEDFPEKVTAFRPGMAVHGKFGEPCPVCETKVQRIAYASKTDMNYCPTCQTEGKLLADRSLSRLLRGDWPKTLEELEERRRR